MMPSPGVEPAVPSDMSSGGLSELAIAFHDAETRLKQTEANTNRTPSSVVNELRYAACHLLRAECQEIPQLDEAFESQHHEPRGSRSVFALEVRRAIDHCKRAKYDAIEFDTVICNERLDLFKKDYRLIFADNIDGLLEALKAAREAQKLLASGKANRSRREIYLADLDSVCERLLAAQDNLEVLRPVLNAWRNRRIFIFCGWLIGILIAIATLVVTLEQSRPKVPNTAPTASGR